MKATQIRFQRIFDVAQNLESLNGSSAAALKRIFLITANKASATVGPELASKYKVNRDNQQLVVSVTNRYTLEQTWFNEARTQKPQTFSQGSEFVDPTNNGANCDFCKWESLTATDPGFGRIELPHAVTGSNLFKYAEPSHGIVLFKHHDPLEFSQAALSDLLDASWLWFQASHKLNPAAVEPFFLWNCLPRAGASQYHGHAQVMLTEVPVPGTSRLRQAALTYQQHHSSCYYADLLRAHAAVGLLRQISILSQPAAAEGGSGEQQQQQHHVAWAFASLAPIKDMEVTVVGQHICCPAFQKAVHAALRAMIEGCGCRTFNVGALNINLDAEAPAGVGLDRHSSSTGSGAGNGSNSNSSSDRMQVSWSQSGNGSSSSSSMASISSTDSSAAGSRSSSSRRVLEYLDGSCDNSIMIPDSLFRADQPPVVARMVSRGKLTSVASDFGCLEVVGGASIGHTDPFFIVRQLDEQLNGAAQLHLPAS